MFIYEDMLCLFYDISFLLEIEQHYFKNTMVIIYVGN